MRRKAEQYLGRAEDMKQLLKSQEGTPIQQECCMKFIFEKIFLPKYFLCVIKTGEDCAVQLSINCISSFKFPYWRSSLVVACLHAVSQLVRCHL